MCKIIELPSAPFILSLRLASPPSASTSPLRPGISNLVAFPLRRRPSLDGLGIMLALIRTNKGAVAEPQQLRRAGRVRLITSDAEASAQIVKLLTIHLADFEALQSLQALEQALRGCLLEHSVECFATKTGLVHEPNHCHACVSARYLEF